MITIIYHYFIYEEKYIPPGVAGRCKKRKITLYNTFIAPGISGGIDLYEKYKYEFL